MEEWRDIIGYEGYYQVSNNGKIKSLERLVKSSRGGSRLIIEKVVKHRIVNGYPYISLYKYGGTKTFSIHQLMAIAFLNHKPNGYNLVINHKDFNRQNNSIDNLEIVTQRENSNKMHLKSTSKYVGTHWHKLHKKWCSLIQINGKQVHLGYFINELDAHHAYQNKLKTL